MNEWSRDWSKLEINEIREKQDMIGDYSHLTMEEREKLDFGLTKEEFVEYMCWLSDIAPEQFSEAIKAMKENE